jgi:uncharacterized membrane protein
LFSTTIEPVTDSGTTGIDRCSLTTEHRGLVMTSSTVLITDMAILVGIFLLGFLAKMFPKNGRNAKR